MRIYVAGPLNADACGYIKNLSKMYRVGLAIHCMGHSPFIPGADVLLGLMAGDFEYADYFNANTEWLKVSDAVFVIASSPGVEQEVAIAEDLQIPIYHRLEDIPCA